MTKIGVISDLHGDVEALDIAIGRMRKLGCKTIVCCGDLVDGDPLADEVIARLREEKIPTIRGNHDRWALQEVREALSEALSKALQEIYEEGDGKLFGGAPALTNDSLKYLTRLPTSWSATIEGVRVVMWHARPKSDMEGIYPGSHTSPSEMEKMLDQVDADVLLVGHTHEAHATAVSGGRLIGNPGTLYRKSMKIEKSGTFFLVKGPGEDGTGGSFGILELPRKRFQIYRLDGKIVGR